MNREIKVLYELNKNSIKKFANIDKENNFAAGTARHAYETLKNNGIIIRPTINLTSMPIKYIGVILLSIINVGETYKTWDKRLSDYILNGSIINKYSLIGYVGFPDSLLLFIPIFKNGELEKTAEYLQKTTQKGIMVKTLVITNELLGSLNYRRFDNKESRFNIIKLNLKQLKNNDLFKYKNISEYYSDNFWKL